MEQMTLTPDDVNAIRRLARAVNRGIIGSQTILDAQRVERIMPAEKEAPRIGLRFASNAMRDPRPLLEPVVEPKPVKKASPPKKSQSRMIWEYLDSINALLRTRQNVAGHLKNELGGISYNTRTRVTRAYYMHRGDWEAYLESKKARN